MTSETVLCEWCKKPFERSNPRKMLCSDTCRTKKSKALKGINAKGHIGKVYGGTMPNHGTWQRYRQNKCRCSRCTIAEAAYRKQLRSLAEERIPDDPRVCEHCPGEVRFPTKAAKHEHVRREHPITRTPVITDKTPNVFDLPTLDMRSW